MKNIFFTLGLLGCTTLAAQAQTSALKLNLLSLPVKTASLFYEHKTNDMASFQIGAAYTSYSVSDTKFSGIAITPEYRFYITGEALQGFFIGPYLRYQNYNLSSTDFYYGSGTTSTSEAKLSTFGGGINLGYQWVFKQHIVLEPFLRLGYNAGSVKTTSGNGNFDSGSFNGGSYLPGLNFGYAF